MTTSKHPPRWITVVVAVAMATLTLPSALPAAGDATDAARSHGDAEIDALLSEKLDEAGPGDTLEVIVQMDQPVDRDTVERAEEHGLGTMPPLDAVPSVFPLQGTVGQIEAFLDEEPVQYATWNAPLTFDLETSTVASSSASVTGHLAGQGGPMTVDGDVIDGSNTTIAVIDSGIDATHPDLPLKKKVVENFKHVCTTPGLVNADNRYCFGNWLAASAPGLSSAPCTSTNDPLWVGGLPNTDTSSGHGTHVASTAAGSGAASPSSGASNGTPSDPLFDGVAPGANLIGFSVGEGGVLWSALSAIDWLACNADEVDPPIVSVNNSYGVQGCNAGGPSPFVETLLDMVTDQGITPVYSAGNDGGNGSQQCTSTTASTDLPGVVMVANYDDRQQGTLNGSLSDSSSRGDATNSTTWPDLSAPGTAITAARATTVGPSTALGTVTTDARQPARYMQLSGTSMAAPHVSGAVALLQQANSSLSPADVETLLNDTAHQFGDPADYGASGSFDKGHGLLDVRAAIEALDSSATAATFNNQANGNSGQIGDTPGTGSVNLEGELFYLRTGPTGVGNADAEYFGWNDTAPTKSPPSIWHDIEPLTNSNEYTIPATHLHGDLVLDGEDVNLTFWARSDPIFVGTQTQPWDATFMMDDHVENQTLNAAVLNPGLMRFDVTFQNVTAEDTSFRVVLDSAFLNTNMNNVLLYDSTSYPTSIGFGTATADPVGTSSDDDGGPDTRSTTQDSTGLAPIAMDPVSADGDSQASVLTQGWGG